MLVTFALFGLLTEASAGPAEAHLFGVADGGWAEGLSHPFSGVDHVLAMVGVGIWAAQIGGPGVFLLPVAFLAAVAWGGVVGGSGLPVPGVETGTAASVAALGLAIALAAKPPLPASLSMVGLFALFHGHAHGTELPETASPVLYGLGLLLATALLHAIGLAVGSLTRSSIGTRLLRVGGAVLVVSGMVLLAGR